METRSARQTAQRAARALVAGRTNTIGDLAARYADLQRARRSIDTARRRGQQLVQVAQQQAQQLLDAAELEAAARLELCATAHQAAREAGWTDSDLTTLGFTKPAAGSARRSSPTSAQTASSTVVAAEGLDGAVEGDGRGQGSAK